MNCPACDDHGLLPVFYDGEPMHIAICLCPTGTRWRNAENNGRRTNPLWQVWATRHHIPFDQIVKLEDYATAGELAAFGFGAPPQRPQGLAAVAAAARRRGR